MNLKLHLILRIILIAFLCLSVTTVYVLHRNNQQSRLQTQLITEAIAKQLQFQLLRINAGFGGPGQFPDFDLWQQTNSTPGICVRYVAIKNRQTRSICTGSKLTAPNWPEAFAFVYQRLYQPDYESSQAIRFNDKIYGTLSVTSSAEMTIAKAWDNLAQLVGLSFFTLIAVCTLVYLTISQALQPAQTIIATLEKIKQGNLNVRLPDFAIIEWQLTATAINQLTSSQQQLLTERQQLAMQLITVQEEERRYLARELHDELGQCLAAINAIAASIKQSATPEIAAEAEQIGRISQRIMDNIRGMLLRLKPIEIDELGLADSLNSLVSEWNSSQNTDCRCNLNIQGDCCNLPESMPLTVYRIAQECLTNISKHAAASQAQIDLDIDTNGLSLKIADNGRCRQLPFPNQKGMGLLGIRERVNALTGKLTLDINKPSGLVVSCWLPLTLDKSL